TFRFTVRLGRPARPGKPARGAAVSAVRNRVALVIDDNAASRRIVCDLLSRWGLAVLPAPDGESALALLGHKRGRSRAVALAVVDATLPRGNGRSWAARLRELPGRADLPVILLATADSAGATAADGPFFGSLLKPVDPAELRGLVLAAAKGERKRSRRVRPGIDRRPAQGGSARLRILLAEDDVINQKVAERMLTRQGHAVTSAANGRRVLQLLDKDRFDLVLMDVEMPRLDGFEVTARIRRREAQSGGRLPIIALTAHALKGDRERCLAAGMDGYLSKPLRPDELFQTIGGVLERVRKGNSHAQR
ncbi:MAG: response regulator, partial [Candidatus Aminicenantes bacterium]|nr:response regulator [Candidatus Aminicenantes bacterium]